MTDKMPKSLITDKVPSSVHNMAFYLLYLTKITEKNYLPNYLKLQYILK
jgi:hypothetical protein